jgi:hypothetical protein
MDDSALDRIRIRQLVDDWALYSDAGDWERFRAVWHQDGRMSATWTQGGGDDFVHMRRTTFESGAMGILHFHGGPAADLVGDRAIAQTKMQILQRAPVEGVLCDVVCTGRFYDFLERRAGRWGFVNRQPIYEKDRLDPLDPSAQLKLDPVLLQSFPEGYRHLAYLQARLGYPVKKDMPGLQGPMVEALYAAGKAWLAGADGHPDDLYKALARKAVA